MNAEESSTPKATAKNPVDAALLATPAVEV